MKEGEIMYEKIKELCKQNGVSFYALEKELKISSGSVCKWEKSTPRVETLQKLADYFGVPITYFLENKEDKVS